MWSWWQSGEFLPLLRLTGQLPLGCQLTFICGFMIYGELSEDTTPPVCASSTVFSQLHCGPRLRGGVVPMGRKKCTLLFQKKKPPRRRCLNTSVDEICRVAVKWCTFESCSFKTQSVVSCFKHSCFWWIPVARVNRLDWRVFPTRPLQTRHHRYLNEHQAQCVAQESVWLHWRKAFIIFLIFIVCARLSPTVCLWLCRLSDFIAKDSVLSQYWNYNTLKNVSWYSVPWGKIGLLLSSHIWYETVSNIRQLYFWQIRLQRTIIKGPKIDNQLTCSTYRQKLHLQIASFVQRPVQNP